MNRRTQTLAMLARLERHEARRHALAHARIELRRDEADAEREALEVARGAARGVHAAAALDHLGAYHAALAARAEACDARRAALRDESDAVHDDLRTRVRAAIVLESTMRRADRAATTGSGASDGFGPDA